MEDRNAEVFFISLSTVLRQVSFDLDDLAFPSAVQRNALLGNASGDIRHTCLIYFHLRLLISVVRELVNVLSSTSMLEMVCSQNIRRIFRRRLFYNVASLYVSFAVIFQHLEPYRNTLRTLLL